MGRPHERPKRLDFNSFSDSQSNFELDTQISDGAVHLGMTQQKLNCTQVVSLLVDLRDLGSAHRLGAVSARHSPMIANSTMLDFLIVSVAAFLAGTLNAVAGGGSFLTFPALVFIGVPPNAANATSAVAVFPGYLSGAAGFFPEIRSIDRRDLYFFLALSVLGGVLGALLLLVTPSEVFSFVVPWLLLFATLLFAFDRKDREWTRGEAGTNPFGKIAATLAVTTYGGYFNGGLGIVLLALFSGLGLRDMNLMNGLKNILSFILSGASVATFLLAGIVYLKEAAIMMLFATLGGYVGARLSRRLPVAVIRSIVIVVGFGMTLIFLLNS